MAHAEKAWDGGEGLHCDCGRNGSHGRAEHPHYDLRFWHFKFQDTWTSGNLSFGPLGLQASCVSYHLGALLGLLGIGSLELFGLWALLRNWFDLGESNYSYTCYFENVKLKILSKVFGLWMILRANSQKF